MTSPNALDLSAYQGEPDFAQLARDGIRVVIVKLTEGVSGIDARGLANVAAARAVRMRVLPYHFLRAGDPDQQAAHFAEWVCAAGVYNDRPCVDFEDEGAASVPTADGLVRFLRALRGALHRRPIVYTNTDKAARSSLAACPTVAALSDLWLARWASTPGAVPAPWSPQQFVLWQTGGGLVAGVRGTVDEDVVTGDLDGDIEPRGGLPPHPPAVPSLDYASLATSPPSAASGEDAAPQAATRGDAQDAPAAPAAQEPPPDIEVSDEAITWDGTDTLETGAPVVPVGGETT